VATARASVTGAGRTYKTEKETMSEIKVELSGENVNQAIATAILESTLGAAIQREVGEYLKKLTQTWDSPIKGIIEQEARKLIIQVLNEHKQQIRAEVEKQMTEAMITRVVSDAIERVLNTR
jgi:hypothetical protein